MTDVIHDALSKFQEIDSLLCSGCEKDTAYFQKLNEATQIAYVIINEGMCSNSTVCEHCAEHRDFLYTILPILEELASGHPYWSEYTKTLGEYQNRVKEILSRISRFLAAM